MYCTLYNYADPPDRFFARGWQELFGYEVPEAAKKPGATISSWHCRADMIP